MIDLSKLQDGDCVDLVLNNGDKLEGWFVYNAACGYFTGRKGTQLEGFMYSESVAKIAINKT